MRDLQEVEIQCPIPPPEKVAQSSTLARVKSTREAKDPGCNRSPLPFMFSVSSRNDWQFERHGGITKSSPSPGRKNYYANMFYFEDGKRPDNDGG